WDLLVPDPLAARRRQACRSLCSRAREGSSPPPPDGPQAVPPHPLPRRRALRACPLSRRPPGQADLAPTRGSLRRTRRAPPGERWRGAQVVASFSSEVAAPATVIAAPHFLQKAASGSFDVAHPTHVRRRVASSFAGRAVLAAGAVLPAAPSPWFARYSRAIRSASSLA